MGAWRVESVIGWREVGICGRVGLDRPWNLGSAFAMEQSEDPAGLLNGQLTCVWLYQKDCF